MSTNYYAHSANGLNPIHLGKSTAGWPFLYRAQPGWTPASAYQEWLRIVESSRLFDELGASISVEQLVEITRIEFRQHEEFAGQFTDAVGRRWDTNEFC